MNSLSIYFSRNQPHQHEIDHHNKGRVELLFSPSISKTNKKDNSSARKTSLLLLVTPFVNSEKSRYVQLFVFFFVTVQAQFRFSLPTAINNGFLTRMCLVSHGTQGEPTIKVKMKKVVYIFFIPIFPGVRQHLSCVYY